MIETLVLVTVLSLAANGWFFGWLNRQPSRAAEVPVRAPLTFDVPIITFDWEGLV